MARKKRRYIITLFSAFVLLATTAVYMVVEAHGEEVEVQDWIVYATPNDHELHLKLFLPASAEESDEDVALRPAVVMFHGGGWIAGTRQQMTWYGREFAKQGYVAASISYRMMPRFRFPEPVYDAKAAVRWMRKNAQKYHIDTDRIAALGHSAGGHLSMMLGTTPKNEEFAGKENLGPSSDVQAVISVYGAVDLRPYASPNSWIRVGGIAKQMMDYFVEEIEDKSLDPLKSASPVSYITKDTAPTFFIHGAEDNVVPVEVAIDAYQHLRNENVPTRFLLLPDTGHSFDHFRPVLRTMIFNEMLDFLEEHLGKAPG